MKIAVCEAYAELRPHSEEWVRLATSVRKAKPDVLLLNEMPFGPWISAGEQPDPDLIERSLRLHLEGMGVLKELEVPVILGTRPARRNGRTVNEAFVWTSESLAAVHTKQYFPDEAGYYEARWFTAGEAHFQPTDVAGLRVGFLICTELMFNEHARRYGRQGTDLLAVPRAVGKGSLQRWLVAMRMAAIVSGCYVASSNRSGVDGNGQIFGGCGWIVDPEGDLVAQTSSATPVASYDLNLEYVRRAQREYPCYVSELR